MHDSTSPDAFLLGLSPKVAAAVDGLLRSIAMTRLPPDVTIVALADADVVMVSNAVCVLRHDLIGLAGALGALGRVLVLARDAEVRRALILLAGQPMEEAPAWAWLCPDILLRALTFAGLTPEQLINRLHASRLRTAKATFAITGHGPPIQVEVGPRGDRLRTVVRLNQFVRYVGGRRDELVARPWTDHHTVCAALGGRPVSAVVAHPLVDPHASILGARIERGTLRVRIPMRWGPLAPLPAHLAAAFPHDPTATRSAVAWRR